MNNNQAMIEFLKEKIDKDTVMKYIFVETMGSQYTVKKLKEKYGIDVEDIKRKYEGIEEGERIRVENLIRKQVKAGEVDLSKEAASWHKQTMKKTPTKETNGQKQGIGEGR